MEEKYSQTHNDLVATEFFGAGEDEALQGGTASALGTLSSTARMVEILRVRNYSSLRLNARFFPGENHMSVIPSNLSVGLRALWESNLSKTSQ